MENRKEEKGEGALKSLYALVRASTLVVGSLVSHGLNQG